MTGAAPTGFPAVEIEALAGPGTVEQALAGWRHVVAVAAGETLGPGRLFKVLPEVPEQAHWQAAFRRVDPVPALKCYFLRDLEVCGDGYLFRGREIVQQASYLSDVAWRGAARDFRDRSKDEIFERVAVDEPVLMAIGPGWQVFGHWLLDFLPRLVVARMVLGERFHEFKIVVPRDTPAFVPAMLEFFLGVLPEQIIRYDRDTQRLALDRVCVPDYGHHNYALHSLFRGFYRKFVAPGGKPTRRVCLTRRRIEATTRSAMRFFQERAAFDEMAVSRGYELICPEELSFAEQIELHAQSWVQIGEHGSAQHASLFAAPGMVVGTVHPLNNVQMQLARLCDHKHVAVMAERQWFDERQVIYFTVPKPRLRAFFDEVEMASTLD